MTFKNHLKKPQYVLLRAEDIHMYMYDEQENYQDINILCPQTVWHILTVLVFNILLSYLYLDWFFCC